MNAVGKGKGWKRKRKKGEEARHLDINQGMRSKDMECKEAREAKAKECNKPKEKERECFQGHVAIVGIKGIRRICAHY